MKLSYCNLRYMTYLGKGYRFIVTNKYKITTEFYGDFIKTKYYMLQRNGVLTIFPGYVWDGATFTSNPTNSILASLYHDVFYQMIRTGYIKPERRSDVDKKFYSILVSSGMSKKRAFLWYTAVRLFGGLLV